MRLVVLLTLVCAFYVKAQNVAFGTTCFGFNNTIIQDKFSLSINLSALINPTPILEENYHMPTGIMRLQSVSILKYSLSQKLRLGLGFHFQRNIMYPYSHRIEYRPFQQAEFTHSSGSWKFIHMLRFNERLVEDSRGEFPISTSIQYKTSLFINITDFENKKHNLYLHTYSEEYFTFSGPMHYTTFSEYWAYLAMGIYLNQWSKLEIGAGYEYMIRNSNKDKRNLWYPCLSITNSFNCSKHNI